MKSFSMGKTKKRRRRKEPSSLKSFKRETALDYDWLTLCSPFTFSKCTWPSHIGFIAITVTTTATKTVILPVLRFVGSSVHQGTTRGVWGSGNRYCWAGQKRGKSEWKRLSRKRDRDSWNSQFDSFDHLCLFCVKVFFIGFFLSSAMMLNKIWVVLRFFPYFFVQLQKKQFCHGLREGSGDDQKEESFHLEKKSVGKIL